MFKLNALAEKVSNLFRSSDDSQGSLNAAPTSSDRHSPTRKRPRSSPEHVTRVKTRASFQRALMNNPDTASARKGTNQLTRRRRFQQQPAQDLPASIAEVISDSEHEDPPSKRSKKSTPARGLNPLTDRRRPNSRSSPEESRAEARLLGGHSYAYCPDSPALPSDRSFSQREPDEITIAEPMSKEIMVQKKPHLVSATRRPVKWDSIDKRQDGGFRRVNTLDRPKQSSHSTRSKYFEDKAHAPTVKHSSRAFATSNNVLSNGDEHPKKKRKIDYEATSLAIQATAEAAKSSSPARTAASGRTQMDTISLDDSQQGGDADTQNHKTPRHRKDSNLRRPQGDPTGPQNVELMTNPAGGATLGLDSSEANSHAHATHQSSRQLNRGPSTNLLNNPNVSDDEPEVVSMASRRHQCKPAKENSDEVQVVPAARIRGTSRRRPVTRRSDELASPLTTVKHVEVPPESPDELQGEDSGVPHQPIKPPTSLQRDMDILTPNQRVASGIRGNPNSTKLSKHQPAFTPRTQDGVTVFQLRDVLAPGLVREQDYYEIRIESNGDFCIMPRHSYLSDEAILRPRRSSDICDIYFETGRGDRVQLNFRLEAGHRLRYSLQLPSHKAACDLIGALQTSGNVTVRDKEGLWMEKSFQKHEEEIEQTNQLGEQDLQAVQDSHEIGRHFRRSDDTSRRVLLRNNLDAPKSGRMTRNRTVIAGRERRGASSASPEGTAHPGDSAPAVKSDCTNRDAAGSVEVFSERSMRSRNPGYSRAALESFLRSPSPQKKKFSQTGGLGDPWKNPLVYPPTGKKRETVDWGSLERLDDDEFLNDTLVGFFLRYVQHQVEQTNPMLMKKMHFFNSYFFDSLTRNAKTRKDINYQTVAKWTKNIDLFQRDFVVVPINEHLHWFLVIICNLSHFAPKPSDDDGDTEEVNERHVPITDGPSSDRAEHETRQSFEELSIHDVDPLSAPRSVSSPGKAGKKGTKSKKRPSLQKYDVKTPIIISLDSLGQPRSATCGFLKQYIVQEAKARHQIDIDEKDIPAMTAKKIPTQGNFSDCGLYVCMYLEQFMRDPNRFVQAILQREEFPWPESIQSDQLRSRLRSLILELHREQEKEERKEAIPELGSIMVNVRDTKDESVHEIQRTEAAPSIAAEEHEARQRLEARMKAKVKLDTPLKATNDLSRQRHVEEPSRVKRQFEARAQQAFEPEAIMIDDDPASPEVKRPTQPQQGVPDLSNHNSPQQLVDKLRSARGDRVPVDEGRQSRGDSVSTDWLQQGGNYESRHAEVEGEALTAAAFADGEHEQPVKPAKTATDSQDSAEIPETQEFAEEQLPELELRGASQARASEDEIIVL